MFLRDIPMPKLNGTKLSNNGKYYGIIVDHYNTPTGYVIVVEATIGCYGAVSKGNYEHNYEQAKDLFEVLDDELPITQPSAQLEKSCKNKWCSKLNYCDGSPCWNCGTEKPTDY